MNTTWVNVALNAGSAITSIVAAIFWFISATGKEPTLDLTWGGYGKTETEILSALKRSSKWNRWAAVFSGISVLLLAIATALSLISNCR
jgi:hypothetical protein